MLIENKGDLKKNEGDNNINYENTNLDTKQFSLSLKAKSNDNNIKKYDESCIFNINRFNDREYNHLKLTRTLKYNVLKRMNFKNEE